MKEMSIVGKGPHCKLPTNVKQLPAFPLEVGPGVELQSWRQMFYH